MTQTILEERCITIVERHRARLARHIELRRAEMSLDNVDHYLLYRVLGIREDEIERIDLYQNIGRFVYRYAGAMLEELTVAVFSETHVGGSIFVPNTISDHPDRFEIDFYTKADNKAHEIKWRDATTDGDHVRKEQVKIQAIVAAGYIPVRVMYYFPQRAQAARIQHRITALYREAGEAYVGRDAWQYIRDYTGFDLLGFLVAQA